MTHRPPDPADLELLSAYLDDALAPAERAALESRLKTDSVLRAELAALRGVQDAVRALPVLKAPRDFRLDPAVYGRRAPARRAYPAARWNRPARLGSALSALAAAIVLAIGLLGIVERGAPSLMLQNAPQSAAVRDAGGVTALAVLPTATGLPAMGILPTTVILPAATLPPMGGVLAGQATSTKGMPTAAATITREEPDEVAAMALSAAVGAAGVEEQGEDMPPPDMMEGEIPAPAAGYAAPAEGVEDTSAPGAGMAPPEIIATLATAARTAVTGSSGAAAPSVAPTALIAAEQSVDASQPLEEAAATAPPPEAVPSSDAAPPPDVVSPPDVAPPPDTSPLLIGLGLSLFALSAALFFFSRRGG